MEPKRHLRMLHLEGHRQAEAQPQQRHGGRLSERLVTGPVYPELGNELCPQSSSAWRSATNRSLSSRGAERASMAGSAEARIDKAPYKPQRVENSYQSPTLLPPLSSGSMANVRYQTVLQSGPTVSPQVS
jgi:hypothetical protein